ncbi:hypothetical protein NCC49_004534 [Naganishia albida]|nr:hypothetical protein NCC49_004534 [Naganishia albida]
MAKTDWISVANNTHAVWYKDAGLRWNVLYGLGLCLVIAANGYSGSLLTGFQAMPAWQKFFLHPKGNRLGIMAASYFLPSVFTAFIGDYLSTRYGRRACIGVGNLLVLAGSLVNAFAVNIGMWIAGRAIIGAGVGITKVAAPVLIQEIAHPRLRPILGSCYQTFAYIGSAVGALVTFAGLYVPGDWGWRFPSVLQALGPIMILIVTWFCPESPRWLLKQGRVEQAHAVLATYHSNGDLDDPLVQLEMREMADALEREARNQQVTFMDFVRTPGNRRRLWVLVLLAFSLNWMGNGIITYYLSPILKSVGIIKPVQITLINAGLAIWNLVIATTAAINVDRFGRRPLFLTSVVGMLLVFSTIMGLSAGYAISKNTAIGIAVVPFLFIYFGFYDIAFTPLPIAYTVEIMPFSIRSKGMALFTATATLGNSFNQFVNPVALGALGWKYYSVYIAILIFYFINIFFTFPETKKLSAEQASIVFDMTKGARMRSSPSARTDEREIESLEYAEKNDKAEVEEIEKKG